MNKPLHIWTTATSEGAMYGPTLHMAYNSAYPLACVQSRRIDSLKCVAIITITDDNQASIEQFAHAAIDLGIRVCYCDQS